MKKPRIVINRQDHERLARIANGLLARNPDLADDLLAELERAVVRQGASVPAESVQMGTTLEYRLEDGRQRRITLVYPDEANAEQGKISVLTPIGVAVLGLSPGQSIDWTAHDGRAHRLTVEAVMPAVHA